MIRHTARDEVRAKLSRGVPSIGTWMQFKDPSVAEVLASRAFDWVAVDLEHGTSSISDLPDICRAIELHQKMPIARMASKDPFDCKRAMDAGLAGVIVPMIETPDEVIRVRNAINFPPLGTRGVGFSRANLFGENLAEHLVADQRAFLVIMIETKVGVRNIEELAAVDGVDAILLGPYDLSASLGSVGNFESHDFRLAVERVKGVCMQVGRPLGVHVVENDLAELRAKVQEGFTFVPFSIDSVVLRGFSPLPGDLRP